MFDVGASEFLLIVVIAVVVIGPKDLPRALRLAGQWIAKVRRVSGQVRSGIETMIREAELAELEQEWPHQNEAIMKVVPAPPEVPTQTLLFRPSSGDSAAVAEPEEEKDPDPQVRLSPPEGMARVLGA